MPLLNVEDMDTATIGGSNFQFSGAKIDSLGATEYTLVTIACDVSGSVYGFKSEMEQAISSVVQACSKSPRADYLLLRLVVFNSRLDEVHGFKQLQDCSPNDYLGILNVGGCTALFDAAFNAAEATNQYAKNLTDQDFDVNGIVVVITDGCDNGSSFNESKVRQALEDSTRKEYMESMLSILVGVGLGAADQYMQSFKTNAGFDQYVGLADADAATLSKLANFVSKSVSAQSQSLGTGGASQALTF